MGIKRWKLTLLLFTQDVKFWWWKRKDGKGKGTDQRQKKDRKKTEKVQKKDRKEAEKRWKIRKVRRKRSKLECGGYSS